MQIFDGLILLVTFLLLWGGHWLPWRVVPALVDKRGDLKRVPSYMYGVLCILAGFAVWCAMRAQSEMPVVYVWDAFGFLAMDIVAAGIGTVLPRVMRWLLEEQAIRGDLADMKHGASERKRD